MLQVMQEVYGIDDNLLHWASLGFAGGIGGCQDVCGAVSGAVISLGLDFSRRGKDWREVYEELRRVVGDFYRGFEQEFGSAECRALTGYDFSQPGGREKFQADAEARRRCRSYVEFAVRKLMQGQRQTD